MAPITGAATTTGWDFAAGPVVVVPSLSDSTRAAIVLPGVVDTAFASISHFELDALNGISLDLFNQQGLSSSTVLHVASQGADVHGCLTWPTGTFVRPVPSEWKVGLEKGKAIPLGLSSLNGMTATDSGRFVSDVLSAATQLANTGSESFHGLPFSVRRGYRVVIPQLSVILAEVVRKINEEANPREEHTLFVAERQPGQNSYTVAFTSRSAGPEESLETSDALAALRLVQLNRPAIVIAFDYEDGERLGLLERTRPGEWKIVWKSAYAGC
jgi:hypothetical protein